MVRFARVFAWMVIVASASCMVDVVDEPVDGLDEERSLYPAERYPLCRDYDFDVNPRRSLFETNFKALAPFTMPGVLTAIAANSGLAVEPGIVHDLLFGTYDVGLGLPGSIQHCDDLVAFDGTPGLNNYPLICPRLESERIGEIKGWFPIAAVNRFDLAPANGRNCGEARLVFAHSEPRVFVIFEAQIPNPSPECRIDACAPVQHFWARLTNIDDPSERAKELWAAYVDGHPFLTAHGFQPFFNFDAFKVGAGQVRTNNFNDRPWTLREYKAIRNNPAGHLRFFEVPVAANPFGEFFDESAAVPGAAKCRDEILDSVAKVVTNNVNLMGVDVDTRCLAAESPDEFVQEYDDQLVPGGTFVTDLANEAALLGNPLTGQQVARRMQFAGACIGCHQQTNGQSLGAGVTAPSSLGFVHTLEVTPFENCGDGDISCFQISPALKTAFLPFREKVMESYLNDIPCCDRYDEFELGLASEPDIDTSHLDAAGIIALEAELDAQKPPLTIGGMPSWRVH